MKLVLALLASLLLLAIAEAQDTNAPLTLVKTIAMPKVEGRIDHMAALLKAQTGAACTRSRSFKSLLQYLRGCYAPL